MREPASPNGFVMLPKHWSLSIVIPAYNEGNRIGKTLARMTSYLDGRGFDYEIIVVDDGSPDDTFSKLESFARSTQRLRIIRNNSNMGKGFAIRQGVLAASMAHILCSDADLSVPIEEVEKLLNKIERTGLTSL